MSSIAASPGASKWLDTDTRFHYLYPFSVRSLAHQHWTPLRIARKAAAFLATGKGVKVLDIGCGVGKFCLAAAYDHPDTVFCGVEQRKNLLAHAETAREILGLKNVHFVHSNFTQLDLRQYDHFYFYNSFYENLSGTDKIDDSIAYSNELYDYYSYYLAKELEEMPAGTRIVTFHSLDMEIPPVYELAAVEEEHLLKYWIKK